MAHQPTNPEYEEIDLSVVSRKVKGYFSRVSDSFFDVLLFFKRYAIIVIVLAVLGAALGYYMDKSNRVYEQELYVIPNFGSVDYLYSKVELLNSKIKEKDHDFLNSIGLGNAKIGAVKIKPVVDIYKFIESREGEENRNYEMVKLLAESNDITDVMEKPVTAKNYKQHLITIITVGTVNREQVITPVLNFLNDTDYYKAVQKEEIANLELRIAATDTTLAQIDRILTVAGSKNKQTGSAIYYKDNSNLNEVIKQKNRLTEEQGENRVEKINYEKIIKESSLILNNKKTDIFTNNMKWIVPLLFIFVFSLSMSFASYCKRQVRKRKIIVENE